MHNVNHVGFVFRNQYFIEDLILVRRTLQVNLNDEERAEVFGTGKN